MHTIVLCCIQNCTLPCPRWRGARLLPRRPAGLNPMCCFAPSLLQPHAGSVRKHRPSGSLLGALLFRIALAAQRRSTCAIALSATGHRQQRQRRRPVHDSRRRWSYGRLGLELTWRTGIIHDRICLVLLGLEHLATAEVHPGSVTACHSRIQRQDHHES